MPGPNRPVIPLELSGGLGSPQTGGFEVVINRLNSIHRKMEDQAPPVLFSIQSAPAICFWCGKSSRGMRADKDGHRRSNSRWRNCPGLRRRLGECGNVCPEVSESRHRGGRGGSGKARIYGKVAAKYNYRYGKEFPFLPSNATTDTGGISGS